MPPTRMSVAAQGSALENGSSQIDQSAEQKHADGGSLQQDQQQHDCSSMAASYSTGDNTPALSTDVGSQEEGGRKGARQQREHDQRSSSSISQPPEQHDCKMQTSQALLQHPQGDSPDKQLSSRGLPETQHDSSEHDVSGQQMESRYVHGVYDIIAGHFSATRFAIWPKVRSWESPALPLIIEAISQPAASGLCRQSRLGGAATASLLRCRALYSSFVPGSSRQSFFLVTSLCV